MKNKTASECWNILRGEPDSEIDSYVPMKKQVKRYKKNIFQKRLSERLHINKICGSFIKNTGKNKDYDACKNALHAAANEVRKSQRNVEDKLAHNLKPDSKSFYAYVRSKQNVLD